MPIFIKFLFLLYRYYEIIICLFSLHVHFHCASFFIICLLFLSNYIYSSYVQLKKYIVISFSLFVVLNNKIIKSIKMLGLIFLSINIQYIFNFISHNLMDDFFLNFLCEFVLICIISL